MISDQFINKNLNPLVTELFMRGKKLSISLVFIIRCYFALYKNIRQNSRQYFVIKIPRQKELKQIAFNHSLDINFQDFMNLYKNCTSNPYYFLVIDTLTSDSTLQSKERKNLVERM